MRSPVGKSKKEVIWVSIQSSQDTLIEGSCKNYPAKSLIQCRGEENNNESNVTQGQQSTFSIDDQGKVTYN